MADIQVNPVVQDLKAKIAVSDVFRWIGATVIDGNGGRFKAFCPFCADAHSRNPGMSGDDSSGLWHCYVCQSGGDIISAAEQHLGCGFREAVEALAAEFGIDLPDEWNAYRGDDEEVTRKKTLLKCLSYAQSRFLDGRSEPEFAEWIASRGMSMESVNAFGIGYIPRGRGQAVISDLLGNGMEMDDLVECGLVSVGPDGRARLQQDGRVTFPIKNGNGAIVGFGGRDITGNARAKYLNTKETDLFQKRDILYGFDRARGAISKKSRAICCEGYMDTIALHSVGLVESVGVLGTALTEENLTRLSNMADDIYLCLDNDDAGTRAAERVASIIDRSMGIRVYVIQVPKSSGCKDPDEWVKSGADASSFEKLMEKAPDIQSFMVSRAIAPFYRRYRASGDESERLKIRREVLRQVRKAVSRCNEKDKEALDIQMPKIVDAFELPISSRQAVSWCLSAEEPQRRESRRDQERETDAMETQCEYALALLMIPGRPKDPIISSIEDAGGVNLLPCSDDLRKCASYMIECIGKGIQLDPRYLPDDEGVKRKYATVALLAKEMNEGGGGSSSSPHATLMEAEISLRSIRDAGIEKQAAAIEGKPGATAMDRLRAAELRMKLHDEISG